MAGVSECALFGLAAGAMLAVVALLTMTNSQRRCIFAAEHFFAGPTAQQQTLIAPSGLVLVQGHGLPPNEAALAPQQPDLQSDPAAGLDVSGDGSAPPSMVLFKYNRCAPECCGTSGGHSCDRGCVCWTPAQRKAFFRGA